MVLNDCGDIAYEQWEKLPERYNNTELDVFQIMPNHMHGILLLMDATPTKTTCVVNIVEAYKSLVANLCLEIFEQKYPCTIMGNCGSVIIMNTSFVMNNHFMVSLITLLKIPPIGIRIVSLIMNKMRPGASPG